MDTKKIIAGAITGFGTAFAVDYHSFLQFPNTPFNWKLAIPRWIFGTVAGALGLTLAG